MKKELVIKAAKELNEVLGLEPPMDLKAPADVLRRNLEEAAGFIEEGDTITKATLQVLKDLNIVERIEEPEPEEAEVEEEEVEEEPEAEIEPEEAEVEEEPATPEAEIEPEEAPKAEVKKEKKKKEAFKSNMDIARELVARDATFEEAFQVFAELYEKRGKGDSDYIAQRTKIYLKLAKKELE